MIRAAEEEAIARHLAEHGVIRVPPAYVVPSPQGALTEREAHARMRDWNPTWEPSINDVINYLRRQCNRKAWSNGRIYRLDGKPATRSDLYAAANVYRRATGLMPYPEPSAWKAMS